MSTTTAATRIGAIPGRNGAELMALLAEFPTVTKVVDAARAVRAAGYTRWDVHTPFPVHGIDPVIGIRPTWLPWLVLGAGLFGLVGGITLQWYVNAHDYQYLISGKPFWSLPANIPVAFETTVLCSALTAVFGMLLLNRLPTLSNPLFKIDRFRRATSDRFFIVVDSTDERFELQRLTELLVNAGATAIERVDDDGA
jgi:hypothetical protein